MKIYYLTAVCMTIVSIFFYFPSDKTDNETKNCVTYKVVRGPMREVIKLKGDLKADQVKKIFAAVEETIVYLIPEGRASKDEILSKLNEDDIARKMTELKKSIFDENKELQDVESELELLRRQADEKIKAAKSEWEMALMTKNQYVQNEMLNQERKVQLGLDLAANRLRIRKVKVREIPDLVAKGFITADRMREEKIQLRKAELELEEAQYQNDLFTKHTKVLDLCRKENDVVRRESDWHAMEKKTVQEIENHKANILLHKANIGEFQKKLDKLKEDYEKLIVRAPFDCLVVHGDVDETWTKKYVYKGGRIWTDIAMFTLPDPSQKKVEAKADETLIGHLKPGMEVSIRLIEPESKEIVGKISSVSEVASRKHWLQGKHKEFQVHIEFAKENIAFPLGITAEATIVIYDLPNVVKVPVHCLVKNKDRYSVRVVKMERGHASFENRNVEIGHRGTNFVEIQSGLKEGELVSLSATEP